MTLRNSDVKPPFKWTGGKNRMREQYRTIFQPPGEIEVFVDMFCGATSVSLWMFENYPNAKFILNDKNQEIIDLYRTIKNDWNSFYNFYGTLISKWVSLTPEDRKKFYYELREKYCLSPDARPQHENHAMLFLMLKTNFNGMWKAYHKCNGRYSTPPGTCTQKAGFFSQSEDNKFKEFIDSVTLESGDFGLLDKYSGNGTYFYADPPYRDSIVEYDGNFNDVEQNRLAQFLKDATAAGSWISESNKEIGDNFWQNLFPSNQYIIHDVSARYTAGRGTSVLNVKEVLITNFLT